MEGRVSPRQSSESSSISFSGTGNLREAVEAAEAASRSAGLSPLSRYVTDSVAAITAVQTSSPARTLLKALPQRLRWRIQEDRGSLRVQISFQVLWWYKAAITFLSLFVVASFAAALFSVELPEVEGFPWLERVPITALFIASVVAVVLVRLLGPLGGGSQVVELTQKFLAQLEGEGPAFRSASLPNTRNYLLAISSYFWVMLLLPLGNYILSPELIWRFFPNGFFIVSILLTFMAVGLYVALILNPQRMQFQLRSDPMLPGILSMLAIVLVLVASIPWQLLGAERVSDSGKFFFLPPEDYLILAAGSSLAQLRESHADFFETLVLGGRLLIAFSILMIALAVAIGRSSILTTLETRRFLQQLQTSSADPPYRKAIGDRRLMRRFHAAFVPLWALFASLIALLLAYLIVTCLHAAGLRFSQDWLRASDSLAGALSYAFDRPFGERWARLSARILWILYGSAALALWLLSVLQLLKARSSERQDLRAQLGTSRRLKEYGLQDQLEQVASRAGLENVQFVLVPDKDPYVAAQCFGLFRQENFVILAEGALTDFDEDELRALVAHELVHLRQGHCRRVVVFRWLGRLTFSGDGFALALQNSFQYEQEADRLVVTEALASSEALRRALVKLRHATPGWARQPLGGLPEGSSWSKWFESKEEELLRGRLAEISPGDRWRLALFLFRQQYFAAMSLHYWHPSYEERIQALRPREESATSVLALGEPSV